MFKHIITIAFTASLLVTANVRAEVVTLFVNWDMSINSPYDYRLRYGNSVNHYEAVNYSFGDVHTSSGGQTQHFFCAGANIAASQALLNGSGQGFVAVLLGDIHTSIMSDYQKESIQSLYNHVYNPLLAAYENLAEMRVTDPWASRVATQQAWSNLSVLNTALQFTLWEIIHETEGN